MSEILCCIIAISPRRRILEVIPQNILMLFFPDTCIQRKTQIEFRKFVSFTLNEAIHRHHLTDIKAANKEVTQNLKHLLSRFGPLSPRVMVPAPHQAPVQRDDVLQGHAFLLLYPEFSGQ